MTFGFSHNGDSEPREVDWYESFYDSIELAKSFDLKYSQWARFWSTNLHNFAIYYQWDESVDQYDYINRIPFEPNHITSQCSLESGTCVQNPACYADEMGTCYPPAIDETVTCMSPQLCSDIAEHRLGLYVASCKTESKAACCKDVFQITTYQDATCALIMECPESFWMGGTCAMKTEPGVFESNGYVARNGLPPDVVAYGSATGVSLQTCKDYCESEVTCVAFSADYTVHRTQGIVDCLYYDQSPLSLDYSESTDMMTWMEECSLNDGDQASCEAIRTSEGPLCVYTAKESCENPNSIECPDLPDEESCNNTNYCLWQTLRDEYGELTEEPSCELGKLCVRLNNVLDQEIQNRECFDFFFGEWINDPDSYLYKTQLLFEEKYGKYVARKRYE
eukprot:UN27770